LSKSKESRQPKPDQRPEWLIPGVIAGIIVILLAIVAIIAGTRSESFEPEVTGAPRAEFDQTNIDHGTVSFEKLVESVFHVRNLGDKPLTILGEPRVELLQGC
jgi:hypothetical protein